MDNNDLTELLEALVERFQQSPTFRQMAGDRLRSAMHRAGVEPKYTISIPKEKR